MSQNEGVFRRTGWVKADDGLTLIELIVSVLVSSVVVLSAVLFLSMALNRYRDTVEETGLMMESQIAINTMREVIMEAKETPKYGTSAEGDYAYLEVRTNKNNNAGTDVTYYHLFVLDKKGNNLLYYGEEGYGPVSAESGISSTILADGKIDEEDLKLYFLADHVRGMSLEAQNTQLFELTLEFDNNGHMYQASETILVRNYLAGEGS